MDPRIKISYDIEENGAIVKKELPFTVGIIADFSGNNSSYSKTLIESRDFIPVTKHSFNEVMKQVDPSLTFSIQPPNSKHPEIPITLQFHSMDDFKPESILDQVPELRLLNELRNQLKLLQINAHKHNEPPDTDLLTQTQQLLKSYLGDTYEL